MTVIDFWLTDDNWNDGVAAAMYISDDEVEREVIFPSSSSMSEAVNAISALMPVHKRPNWKAEFINGKVRCYASVAVSSQYRDALLQFTAAREKERFVKSNETPVVM